jgi:hypothetical protein
LEFVMTLVWWFGFIWGEEKIGPICHCLAHGRPIWSVSYWIKLFLLLKVKNNPLKHWLNNNGSFQELVMSIFAKANYFFINANEVTFIA